MRRLVKSKKLLTAAALCSFGVMQASAVWWAPAGTNASNWNVDANWNGGLPLGDTKVQFSSSVETECFVDSPVVSGQLVMGDGGTEGQKVTLRIANGGILNSCQLAGGWAGVGYNREAHCIVESGGIITNGNRLGVGMVTGGKGLFEVSGEVVLAGVLQVANGGDSGKVFLYEGGTIQATGLEMGGNGVIDLWETGALTLVGDHTNAVNTFIADGKIIGNRLTNNLDVVENVIDGVTNVVVSATPSIPNLAGLTEAEATEMLTTFGYVVGNVSTGAVPGGVTGLVAASVPAAGSAPGSPGSSVDLIIQEAGQVPDLIGLYYDEATNVIVQSGYTIGTLTEVYEFDNDPGLVTDQDPAGMLEADLGSPVGITFNERLGDAATTTAEFIGDWNSSSMWSLGEVPARETQNYEVHLRGGATLTLTNWVAMRRLHIGHNGYEVGPATLNVMDGGHLISAMYNNYTAAGWNADCVINVYSNGIFESREALRVGWIGTSAEINIDGGSVIAHGWMSLGRTGQPSAGNEATSSIMISNGGSLLIDRFHEDYQYGTITVAGGTFATTGSNTNDIWNAMTNGVVVVGEGFEHSIKVIDGNATLTAFIPSYEAWAGQWGDDIGPADHDHDNDGADNLWEYGLNGDPTDDQDTGVDPVFTSEGGVLKYIHLERTDDTNLVYTIQTRESLMTGDWLDTGASVEGSGNVAEFYDSVTNTIDTTNPNAFIRLKIENP